MLLGKHDDRPMINMVQPGYSAVGLTLPAARAALIKELENKGGIWEGLSGGGAGKHKYAKHLSKFSNLETRVGTAMTWYIRYVQATYPDLKHVKYGALKTATREGSQYRRHSDKLHSDYQVEFSDCSPQQRLVSIIVALNAFQLIFLPTKFSSRKDWWQRLWPQGKWCGLPTSIYTQVVQMTWMTWYIVSLPTWPVAP